MDNDYEFNSDYKISEIKVSYEPLFPTKERRAITTSQDSNQLLKAIWDLQTINFREEFIAVYLNRANYVLGIYKHATGTESACVVSLKQILAVGFKCNASSFILAHNHPSGSLKASKQDISLTEKIKKASEICDMRLLDHLILTDKNGYFAFADNGLI